MERTIKVGTQELTVKPLTWEGWKKVKTSIANALAGQALPEMLGTLMDLFKEDGVDKSDLMSQMANSPAMKRAVTLAGPAAIELVDSVDGLTDLLIEETTGCKPTGESAADVIRVRDVALEVADLPGLFAAEKNSLAAVWTRMAANKKSNGSETPSNSAGTPPTNPN